jgi:membrane fusion protein (multidrug efflux system)
LARSVPFTVIALSGLLMLASVLLYRSSPTAQAARERDQKLAEAASRTTDVSPQATRGVVIVDAHVAATRDARIVVDISGSLVAVRTSLIGSEAPGRVVSVEALDNQPILAGATLVQLDTDLAAAAFERARAGVVRAESGHSLATQEHNRQTNLSGRGIASEAEFDRTLSEEASSQAMVAEAHAQLAEAQVQLDKTRISAPFAGVVSDLDVEPGTYLRIGDPVARLSDLSQIEVEVGVDDRQILSLRGGDPVRLQVDAYPGEWFEGVIHSLGRSPDRVTHKYPVPVRFENPGERLLPGMLGKVRFDIGEAGQALRIPRRASLREFEIDYVYVLARGDDASSAPDTMIAKRRRVAIRPVPFRPELIDVTSGLQPGEVVAISGHRELRDGLSVRMREPPGESARP